MVQHPFLEGGREERLQLEIHDQKTGSFPVSGYLVAKDSEGNPFRQSFGFRLDIGPGGLPYQPPKTEPYIVGPGVNRDKNFAGRQELLSWLRSLWSQEGEKPAVVLVGQRRIEKTSLLNKIQRDGLEKNRLYPIFINVQGLNSEYDFLNGVSQKMSRCLNQEEKDLPQQEVYSAFKKFLHGLAPLLEGHRFLLMLDEADLIPKRHLGELLPGFLRALMQEPDYPTLLP